MKIEPAIRRILVLDDDAFILKIVSHTLRRLGYEHVVTTSSAAQALALLGDGDAVGVIEKPVRAEALEALLAQWQSDPHDVFVLDPPPVKPDELRRGIDAGELIA